MEEADPRDALIAELRAQVAERDARIAQLMAKVEKLTARVAELEARLGQNSNNSSRPPSSDGPGARRQPKKPTGRRSGGQPGHKKHERALLPVEQVRDVVDVVLEKCRGCEQKLKGQDSAPQRQQVVEVSPLSAFVTEYRCPALKSTRCGVVTRGEVPERPRSLFGDRLTALASLLVGKYRLSNRLVKEALSDMLGVELSVGRVSHLEDKISQALAPAAAEELAFVQKAEAVKADETGFVQGRKEGCAGRAWL